MAAPTTPRVTFAGLTLEPFRYAERPDEEGLAIDLQATLTEAQTTALRELQAKPREYFEVVRAAAEPVRMRLGRVIWHEHDGGVDHGITLVSEEYDANAKPWITAHDPEVWRLMEAVASLRRGMNMMVDAIESGEPLDAALVAKMRTASGEAAGADLWIFREVEDVKDHWLRDEDELGD
jgi:hypothetical protein